MISLLLKLPLKRGSDKENAMIVHFDFQCHYYNFSIVYYFNYINWRSNLCLNIVKIKKCLQWMLAYDKFYLKIHNDYYITI